MGVDYYPCECCGDALYEEYVAGCEDCDKSLCVDCLVDIDESKKDDNYTYPFTNDDGYIKKEFCPYCSGNVIDEHELLIFVLEKYNINKEEVEAEFLKTNK